MGYSYFKTSNTIELGNEFTVQLVTDTELGFVDKKPDGSVLHDFQNIWGYGSAFGIFLNRQYDKQIAATNIIWKEDGYSETSGTGNRPYFPWDGKYLNAAFDAEYSYLTQDSYWINKSKNRMPRANPIPVEPFNYCWGGCSSTRYCSIGTIHAWRAYSRKLTDDELAWNREIDEIRFRGALPKYIPNAVAVTSSRSEFTAKEDGVYLLTGSYAFTAERKVIDGITYAPKYEVQSWNGESGNWEAVSSGSCGSCLLNQADSTVPRRIVWKWFKEGFSVIIR